MPNIRCFCVFECAGNDIENLDKIMRKQRTRARDLERLEAEKETMVNKSKSTLENTYLSSQSLGALLEL